jgi:DNA-binding response OmpR family regulator
MTARVLLIEGDEKLGLQIVEMLRGEGLDVSWIHDGASALVAEVQGFALLVLDLVLPGADGLEVLQRWRERSDLPVLVLSGKNTAEAKVRALETGADDCMTKPFWPEELLARVRARLRRPLLTRGNRIEIGPISVDVAARTVRLDGRELGLTRVEFELLCALARRAGAAVDRGWLVDNVLDSRPRGDPRTLDVHVSRLRKKLGAHGARLVTVWGVGYRLQIDGIV